MDDEVVLAALANADWLKIMKRLVEAGPTGMIAGAIATDVGARAF